MKILGNESVPTPAIQRHSPNPGHAAEKDFGTVLRETVARPSQPAPEPMVSSIAPCAIVKGCLPTIRPDTDLLVERVGKLLDSLDVYRHKLADTRCTVRDMYPDIQRFSQESRDLMPMLDSLPESDGLKDVLNQTLMTATLEVIRYYRGDYVTT